MSGGWSDEVPAIIIRNSVSEQGHRVPDPRWQKALGFLYLVVGTGTAVALMVLAISWAVGA